jgi:hypothetical protein
MTTALLEKLFQQAFHQYRDPRSDAYKDGAKAGISFRLGLAPIHCPYEPGSAEYDAWFAGLDEGKAIAYRHSESATSGAVGGSATSEAKKRASKENGKRGGRPRYF